MSQLVFDKYELIRRLAIGGMGEIFLARQRGVAGFDRLVILKSLLPELAEDETLVEQFLNEARVAATLNHPNIVAVHEVGRWQSIYFIAMEYVSGENLGILMRQVLRDESSVDYEITARVIFDAATGLAHAHAAEDLHGVPLNVVHRDISLQNIMVNDDGVTKIVDFGIARAANRTVRTATGALKGRLGYMAPEQLRHEPSDARSDQYSLGVVMWEMCAGRRLYPGGSADPAGVMHRILNEPTPRLREVHPDCPAELDGIVQIMTADDPRDRFESCAEVAQALGEYLEHAGTEMGTDAVAQWVDKTVGDDLQTRRRDLAPEKKDFLIDLRSGAVAKKSRGRRIAAAVAILTATVALGLGGVLGVQRFVQSQPQVSEAAPAAITPATTTTGGPAPAAVPPTAAAVLEIASEPSGASVSAGDLVLGATPRTVRLAPGVHQLRFRKKGFETVTESVTVEAGATDTVSVTLQRKERTSKARKGRAKRAPAESAAPPKPTPEPAPPAEDGLISVITTPWSDVTVGQKHLGVTPIYKRRIAPGSYVVRMINRKAGIDQTKRVTIGPGIHVKVNETLQ